MIYYCEGYTELEGIRIKNSTDLSLTGINYNKCHNNYYEGILSTMNFYYEFSILNNFKFLVRESSTKGASSST